MTDLVRYRVPLPCPAQGALGPGWTDLYARAGTDDELVVDEVWVQDVYHLNGLTLHRWRDDMMPVVIDLGANIGGFTCRVLRQFPDAQLIAVEPDSANAELFSRNVEANGFADRCTFWCRAIGKNGDQVAVVGTGATAHTVEGDGPDDSESVRCIGWNESFRTTHVALLKVDVEGAEYDALLDADFSRVHTIVMEWHGLGCAKHLEPDDGERYGRLMAWLGRTHTVQTFGRPDEGGMLYATRYDR